MEKWLILIESNIPREANAMSGRIIAAIPLVLKTIPKKNALDRLNNQLGPLTRC